MEKKYNKVDPVNYVNHLSTYSDMEEILAEKSGKIMAVVGTVGDEIITYSQDGMVETVNVVKQNENGDFDIVATKVDDDNNIIVDEHGNKNSWIIEHDTFHERYTIDGGNIFKPAGGVQKFIQVKHDITFKAPWGADMNVDVGGYLNITNSDDIYGISERDFKDTYRVIEKEQKTK